MLGIPLKHSKGESAQCIQALGHEIAATTLWAGLRMTDKRRESVPLKIAHTHTHLPTVSNPWKHLCWQATWILLSQQLPARPPSHLPEQSTLEWWGLREINQHLYTVLSNGWRLSCKSRHRGWSALLMQNTISYCPMGTGIRPTRRVAWVPFYSEKEISRTLLAAWSLSTSLFSSYPCKKVRRRRNRGTHKQSSLQSSWLS